MLSKERVLEVLKEAGVLQEGHFLLTSGTQINIFSVQRFSVIQSTAKSSAQILLISSKMTMWK